MKKIIKLTENQLAKLVRNIIKEDEGLPNKVIQGIGKDNYDYKRENGKYYTKLKTSNNWINVTGTKYEENIRKLIFNDYANSPSSSPSQSSTISKTVPFKNTTEGNEFRSWVIKNYPNVAAATSLSPTGEYNNSYITNAWNYKVGNESVGGKFLSHKKTNSSNTSKGSNLYGVDPSSSKIYSSKSTESEEDWSGIKGYQKRSIELAPLESIPQVLKGAAGDRMNREIHYINQRSEYKGKPFFIIDPRLKLVAAFDESHKFIRLSQTVEGEDKQPTKPVTYREWCESAGFKCKNPSTKLECSCFGDLSKQYPVLSKIGKRALSAGIYKAGGTSYESHYTGAKNVDNVIKIKTQSGIELPSAIHALVPISNRIEADAELKKYLGDAQKTGKIPQQYNDLINNMIGSKKYDLSTGCFNVDASFANDSRVLDIAKKGAMIFVMSEDKDYYLVQMDNSQGAEFFNELKGENGFCKKPTSIATQVGGEPIDIRKTTA